ncbi:hypothetical protein BKA58DRAFT_143309 [Alternaria rosae]|uniref:uncharacterized protein n=1 Tax=Alternaria rosae TaxID=1187941 RepID=UPI001E8EA7EE|nr:uncharacterized protein BKA58DRAFT_143309 [Alternaria rosae]KAH6872320.1 hypothetical protein BKA58DRAFT_143309 [Alternaria rosae]
MLPQAQYCFCSTVIVCGLAVTPRFAKCGQVECAQGRMVFFLPITQELQRPQLCQTMSRACVLFIFTRPQQRFSRCVIADWFQIISSIACHIADRMPWSPLTMCLLSHADQDHAKLIRNLTRVSLETLCRRSTYSMSFSRFSSQEYFVLVSGTIPESSSKAAFPPETEKELYSFHQ